MDGWKHSVTIFRGGSMDVYIFWIFKRYGFRDEKK